MARTTGAHRGADLAQVREVFSAIEANITRVVSGKPDAVRLMLTALLAEGHILVEDVPGVG